MRAEFNREMIHPVDFLLGPFDLFSLGAGLAGTILLAYAVGVPSGSAAEMSGVDGRWYKMAFMFPERWKWGIRLIVLAFALQLPKVILGLIHTVN